MKDNVAKIRFFFTFLIVVYTLAWASYTYLDYSTSKNKILKNIDLRLFNSAIALKYMLPEDFHDRAIDAQSVSIDEDKYIANKLTSLVKEAGFKYAYTIIKKEDKLYFVACDLIADPENERGTFYYYEYEGADESFIDAFDKVEPTYKTVSDQWGTFRTVMVPEKSPGGVNYLACVDYDITYVKGLLNKNSIKSIVTVLFFLFLSVLILIIYSKIRRKHFEDLMESEERYRNIFNSLTDVYFKTTLDGTIENASPSAKTISGYSPAELTGKKVDILYQNPKDREGLLAVLKQNGQARGYEILFKKKNGELYHTSINADLNYNKNGEPTSLTGTIRDITESKQAEKEKILAQKIASKNKKLALVGQVAGKMAHDFNNILGIVMGNTELALLDCQEPKTKKTLELIYKQTIRGRNLTRNLVAFAKDQEPKQKFFRISEKIDLVLNLMRKDLEGIELRKEESPGVPELLADPGMIEYALVNLIQNSIHALSMVEYPRITIRTYSRDNHICFEIEDNGCGIPKENLENIYEPSFTLKGSRDLTGSYKNGIKGSGYGMSNVKKYIEQHKGNISIESVFGSGTKFTIRLPVIKKDLTIEEKIELQEEIKHFEKYILLVEDETAISDVQYRILTDGPCNHKVDIANTGKIAMDLFDRNEYDFVSLDYVLPGGINGMDFYHHVRETNKTIPILFISGNIEFLESIKELKQKDAYIDHLSKPCQNKEYLNGINELLGKTLTEQ